jgi:hypothetical protein
MFIRSCAAVVLAALAGCGLISDDIDDLDLSLPSKTYTVDTSSWQFMGDPQMLLGWDCGGGNEGVCPTIAEQVCTAGQCESVCGPQSTCDMIIPVHPFTTINLAQEKEELATINEQALVEVVVDTIEYAVTENTLDITTPPLVLYVAPESVMDPDDSLAVEVGTIAPVPPMTTVPTTRLELTSAGHARLVQAMTDFRTPFNVMVAADIVLRNGDTLPTGRITTSMTIDAHASAF